MGREVLPVTITVEGRFVRSSTDLVSATAHVLVLATTLADPAWPIGLHSSYVGQRGGETRATHLALLPGEPCGRLTTFTHPRAAMPVAEDDRHPCLYDHLQQMLSLLQDEDLSVSICVGDRAVELVDA